jgi:ligand-binding sensor domain-containing protein/two-component sensor histidine kinase
LIKPLSLVIATFIYIFSCFSSAIALDPKRAITQHMQENWTSEEGLPQNTVFTILQTSDGYIWIGTEEGLARFDGLSFRIFDRSNTPAISHNYICSLYEDSKGTLWISTYGGGLVRLHNQKFSALTMKDGLPDDRIWTVHELQDGTVLIGTDSGGLAVIKDEKISVLKGISDSIVAIYEDSIFVWLGTRHGVNLLCKNSNELTMCSKEFTQQTYHDPNGYLQNPVRAILPVSEGSIAFATSEGLVILKNRQILRYTKENGLPENRIWSLLEDKKNNLWIGTDGGGLARWSSGKLSTYSTLEGLPNNYIRALFEDKEGTIWVGTNGGGLVQLKDLKFTNFGTKEGLSGNFIRPILEDSTGTIWIGTDGSGLNLVNQEKIRKYSTSDGLSDDKILSLHETRNGDLWIGTVSGGLNRFKNGKFQVFGTKEKLPGQPVLAIYEDNLNQLWIGTSGGVSRYIKGNFETFTTAHGLSNNRVRSICETKEGLWIGTRGGLSLKIEKGFKQFSMKDGLSSDFITYLYPDRDHNLWIGTVGGGLNLFKNSKFYSFSTQDGLFDNSLFGIVEDFQGRLWMTSNKGVFSIQKQQLQDFISGKIKRLSCESYGTKDGMRSSECNGGAQPGVWMSRDGKLLFPTTGGVAILDVQKVTRNQEPPILHIESIKIDERFIDLFFSAKNKPFDIEPGQGRLEFHYAGLSFLVPSGVKYKYRLTGFDSEWIDAGTRRDAYYTNIPPGQYQFEVIGSNNDGVWTNKSAAFAFYLRPHFYQTFWFYILCATALGFIIWRIHRYRVSRSVELERVRTRIASDLHDDIGSGLSQIAILSEVVRSKQQDSNYAGELNNIAASSRELVDSMSDIVWAVNPAKDYLGDLVQRMRRSAIDVLEMKGISLKFESPGLESGLPIAPDVRRHVFLIFKESLNNVVKHSACTQVSVRIEQRNGKLILTVQDDGKGFEVKDSNGHGLQSMPQRAKEIKSEFIIRSSPGSGTTLELQVPISKNNILGGRNKAT